MAKPKDTAPRLYPHVTFVLSVIGVVLGALNWWNAILRALPESDYAVRLEVQNEKSVPLESEDAAPFALPPPDAPNAKMRARGWSYDAELWNAGSKTVQVEQVALAYGAERDRKQRIRFVLARDFYLQPNTRREISHSLNWEEIEEIRARWGECMLELEIGYLEADGTKSIRRRPALGIPRNAGGQWDAVPGGVLRPSNGG